MAIKASGNPLSFSEIEAEFGQNNDRDLGEYRVSQTVGALSNQPLDTGIPQSGEIKFSDFYSKRLNVIVDYHDTAANNPADAKSKYTQAATVTGRSNGNWTVIGQFKNPPSNTGGTKTRIHVNKNIGSAKGSVSHCAVRTSSNWDSGTVLSVEIGASGKIIGAGGDGGAGGNGSTPNGGNGTDGTSALGIQYEGTSIFNNGDIIAGGGGGGGGGYRKVEREENWGGPVYAANGGGGGGGQGLPNGTGGAVGSASGTTTFVSDGIFNDTDTSYNNAVDVGDVTNGVFRKMGMIASVDNFQNTTDSNRTAGTYSNVTYSAQGSGMNATFTITVDGNGTVTNVTINQSGKGYVVNNTITVNDSQLGNGGAANFKFDVASISDEFKFRRNGSTVGTNLDGDPLIVGSGVGSKRYIRVPKDNDSDNVTGGQPDEQVSNAPVNQIWRIEQFTLQSTNPGGGAGSNSSNTAGGSGGNGGNNSQAKGGGGGGGGFAASGGEGGNNNDGGAGTSSKGGNGAAGTHTGSIEGENNVQGSGGTGGESGAAIRKSQGEINVTISNDANSALFGGNAQAGNIQGVTNAAGVTAG